MRAPWILLTTIALVSACGPLVPQATSPVRPNAGTQPTGTVPGVTPPLGTTPTTPGLDTAPLISNNAGNLIGKVKAPAGLISNNGGGLISDKGGGLISDKGGNYRVTAVSQLPVAGATVRLVDAAGQAVMGPEGQPLVTTTDAQGNYGFTAALPPQHLLVEVTLPGDKGTLQAIAPRPEGATQRQVEVELVSTLTTTYILDQYVKTQKDPVLTLEKLPADVEAATRQKAASALDSGSVATPDALTPAKVVETVNQLRAKDSSFNAQMESVKKLLIAAGLSDLGNGQKATDVLLNPIRQVLAAPDGGLYLNDGVVWRVTPEGVLVRLTASGAATTGNLDGVKAVDAKLGSVRQLSLDPQGRLWVLQDRPHLKLWRLESDGTLKDMTRGVPTPTLFAPTGGDGFWAFSYDKWGDPVTAWEAPDGGTPKLVHTFSSLDVPAAASATVMGRDAQGRLVMAGLISPSIIPKVLRFDPTSKVLSVLKSAMPGVSVDPDGTAYYRSFDDKVHAIAANDADTVLFDFPGMVPSSAFASRGKDGSLYVVGGPDNASVYRLKGGEKTLMAGKEGQGVIATSDPTTLALKDPLGLGVGPDGTMVILDDGALLRFDPGSGVSTLLASGALTEDTATINPWAPKLLADGTVYFIGRRSDSFSQTTKPQAIWRIKPGGQPEKVYASIQEIQDYLLAPDGTLTVAELRRPDLSNFMDRINRRAPDGTVTPLVSEDQGFVSSIKLSTDAQGRLLFYGMHKDAPGVYTSDRIWRWTPADGAVLLPESTFWPEARDAQGREYWGYQYSSAGEVKTVRRYDPATGKTEILAGAGGRYFSGAGVDDGIAKPMYPTFDGQGNLYFLDMGNKQIKRIPAQGL